MIWTLPPTSEHLFGTDWCAMMVPVRRYCQMRTMSLSESGDSTKEISFGELIDNFVADDFSSIISRKISKISLFFFI